MSPQVLSIIQVTFPPKERGSALSVYVNGALVASRAVSDAIVTATGALRLGGHSIWGEYFQGRLDEVRIYNRALSAPEIQSDMQTPITQK